MVRIWAVVCCALVLSTVNAEESAVRGYPLPKHGMLELEVPVSWKDSVQQPPRDLPPTISFSSQSGSYFQVLITPIWSFRPNLDLPTRGEMKASVRQAADGVTPQAVEKTIEVKELDGATGYYFSATDRAPKPGEFKYLTQGMLSVSGLSITFTILTNDGQDAIVKDALTMLKNATYR